MTTKGEIPTVETFQQCNYEPKAAFMSILRICQMELAQIQAHSLSEMTFHYAMLGTWEGQQGWEIVSNYIELAKGLRAVYERSLGMSSAKRD